MDDIVLKEANLSITSAPNELGQRTRATLNVVSCTLLKIEVLDTTDTPVQTLEAAAAKQGLTPLFLISLQKLQLDALRKGEPYKTRDALQIVPRGTPEHALDQLKVRADTSQQASWKRVEIDFPAIINRPTGALELYVRVVVTAPEDTSAGWLHFELSLSFPTPTELDGDPSGAWERSVDFPHMNVGTAQEYVALLPGGRAMGLAAPTRKNSSFYELMTTQMGAIYTQRARAGQTQKKDLATMERAAGILLSSDDERGHNKSLLGTLNWVQGTKTRDLDLATRLQLPVFLRTASDGRQEQAHEARFDLSGGDDQGFGGARMRWRLMGFEINAEPRGAERTRVDWEDIAALYRRDLERRDVPFMRPGFEHGGEWFSKDPPRPMRTMSAFTVIPNYGLDGPGEVGPKGKHLATAQMLEINPFRVRPMGNLADTDGVPGAETGAPHAGESLQHLAYRLSALLSRWHPLGVATATGGGEDPALFSTEAGRVELLYAAINEYVWEHYPIGGSPEIRDRLDIGGELSWDGPSVVRPPDGAPLGVVARALPEGGLWTCVVDLFSIGAGLLTRNRYRREVFSDWKEICALDATSAPGVAALSETSVAIAATGGTEAGITFIEVLDAGRGDVPPTTAPMRIPGTENATGRPALVNVGAETLDCHYRTAGDTLMLVRRQRGIWGTPEALPALPEGGFGSAPSATSGEAGRADVVVCDTERRVWHTHRWFSEPWAPWTLVDAELRGWGDPVVFAQRPNRLDLAVRPARREGGGWGPDGGVARWAFGAQMDLECQLWGIEMGGFYRWLGAFPANTDALTGTLDDGVVVPSDKLRRAVEEMRANRCHAMMTTTPQHTFQDRAQMSNLPVPNKDGGMRMSIRAPLPDLVVKATWAETDAPARAFFASRKSPEYPADPKVDELMAAVAAARRRDAWANPLEARGEVDLCPLTRLTTHYLDFVSQNLFGNGLRDTVEYMCLHPASWWCFDPTHQHLDPGEGGLGTDYDRVIGCGPWFFDRMRALMAELRRRAHADQAAAGLQLGFAISHEFEVPDVLIPYVDEIYFNSGSSLDVWTGDACLSPEAELVVPNGAGTRTFRCDPASRIRLAPLYRLVHGARIRSKMTMIFNHPFDPPGYQEILRDEALGPTTMLDPARDGEGLGVSSDAWWDRASADLERACSGCIPGLSTQDLPLGQGAGTYSFRSGQQQIANLRTAIFRLGLAAVLGERTYLQSLWARRSANHRGRLLPYHLPLLELASRAVRLQTTHAATLTEGRMLGHARVYLKAGDGSLSAGRALGAWRFERREFVGVKKLLHYYKKLEGAAPESIEDPLCRDRVSPSPTPCQIDEVVHMVWEDSPERPGLLYALANISNTDHDVKVCFTRGVVRPVDWELTIRSFADGVTTTEPAQLRTWSRTVHLPARSFATLELRPV